MKNTSNKGFTLIELLVVIAIIGILSSVVLASLNTARSKGADSAIKGQLANARAQAEIYYDNSGASSYAGVCTSATSGIANMKTGAASNSSAVACYDSANGWIMTALLKTSGAGYWCVDSTGASKSTSTAATAVVAC